MAGTYNYNIETRDLDATLRMRLPALGDLLLRAAGDDADTLGFGVEDLGAGGASWVLSRLAVEMERLPRRGEGVAIYTWVSDYGRFVTTRNMVVSVGGVQIGAAVTQWAMIDLATRRPLDLAALAGKNASLLPRGEPISPPRRIAPFECAGQTLRRVAYSDIDFNGHVGSMKYLEWAIDAASPESHDPSGGIVPQGVGFRLDVNYLHEARLGQSLTVCRGAGGPHDLLFDIRGEDDISICKTQITLR